jgi:hypothetical protein
VREQRDGAGRLTDNEDATAMKATEPIEVKKPIATVTSTATEEPVSEPQKKGFGSEHILWFLGLVPVGLAAIKILIVSGGDPQVFNYLLRNLNVVALVISIILPLIPLAAFWFLVSYFDRRYSLPKDERKEMPFWFSQFVWLAWLASIGSMSVNFAFGSSVVIISILVIRLIQRLRYKKAVANTPVDQLTPPRNRAAFGAGSYVAVLCVQFLFNGGVPWISTESIVVKGSDNQATDERGQVVEVGDPWTTILLWPRDIQIVETKSIISREPCVVDSTFLSGTVGGRVFGLFNSHQVKAKPCPNRNNHAPLSKTSDDETPSAPQKPPDVEPPAAPVKSMEPPNPSPVEPQRLPPSSGTAPLTTPPPATKNPPASG